MDLPEDVKRKPEVLRLVRTVERHGGRYFTADSAGELAEAARGVDALDWGVLVSTRYVYDIPAFEAFAAAAIGTGRRRPVADPVLYFVDLT